MQAFLLTGCCGRSCQSKKTFHLTWSMCFWKREVPTPPLSPTSCSHCWIQLTFNCLVCSHTWLIGLFLNSPLDELWAFLTLVWLPGVNPSPGRCCANFPGMCPCQRILLLTPSSPLEIPRLELWRRPCHSCSSEGLLCSEECLWQWSLINSQLLSSVN